MKLRKTIKRMVALATGATMLGATVMGAMAADLSNYPQPFVKDGQFNALIVFGAAAATSDVIGAVDIATNLQYEAKTKKTVSTGSTAGTTTVAGDSWMVGTSTKKFELSEYTDSTDLGKREYVSNITSYIGKDELSGLAAGTFSNNKGDFLYNQYIRFDQPTGYVQYSTDTDRDTTADYLTYANDVEILRYELEFTSSAESDLTDSAGTAATSGTYLYQLENKKIKILGKEYQFAKARIGSSDRDKVELTLMSGAISDTLAEGESKTYTLNGKAYNVELTFVGTSNVKFKVNDETTNSIEDGNTEKLSDGTTIGVSDILSQAFAGGTRKAEFYFGANKILIQDADFDGNKAYDTNLKVNDETIDGAYGIISGSNSSTTWKIDTIGINITADDDLFIGAGEKLSQRLSEPEGLLELNMRYEGLTSPASQDIEIEASGDTKYKLSFYDGSGKKVSIPLAYTSGGTTIRMGDDSDVLVVDEKTNISKNDYFIVTDESQSVGKQRATYALRYKGATVSSDSTTIKFKELGSGESIEKSWTVQSDPTTSGADFKLGGATFKVRNTSSAASNDFKIQVDLNADGTFASSKIAVGLLNGTVNITTNYGAMIQLDNMTHTGAAYDGIALRVSTPNSDDYNDIQPTDIVYNITAASGKVTLASTDNHTLITPEGETNVAYAYTAQGAFLTENTPTSGRPTITVKYPKEQRLPQVFMTLGTATASTASSSESGAVTYYETNAIQVGAAVLDTDPALGDVKSKNVILVGGPCANTATAEIMGSDPVDCGAGFEPGKAKIKLYTNSGNVAMVVAGYSAMDTRRASKVVAQHGNYDNFAGAEVEVTGTTLADITVSKVAAAATS